MRIAKKTWHRLVQTLALPLVFTAGWAATAVFVHVTILRAVFSIAFLSLVPGYFALRSLIGYRDKESGFHIFSYSLGLSLIILMLAGLGLNQIALLFHVARPLTTVNLAATIAGVTSALILTAALRKRPSKPQRSLLTRTKPFFAALPTVWPAIVLPIIAVGGAITLNNGGSNWLAMTGLGGVGLYFLVLAWKNKHAPKWYAAALYGICLTILLGTSMRGWHITGHDVMQEYQVFQLTLQHAAWHMFYYQDAYNACLSITILPTIFQKLTGIADPYIYKFVFQLFFATIAPILYVSLRKYTSRKIAFLSVFLFLAFPTFLTDMTMLNRQDIALLCLALSLQAGLDTRLRTWHKHSLVFIFLVGMVLSHYSTSYIALGTLGFSALLTVVWWLVRRLPLKQFKKNKIKPRMNFAIYHPLVIVGALLTIFCWNTLFTHTSNNIAKTIKDTVKSAPQIAHLSNAKSVTTPTPQGSQLDQYTTHAESLRTLPPSAYYSKNVTSAYPVTKQEPAPSPEQPALRSLRVPGSVLTLLYNGTRQVYALAIEVLIFAGLAIVIIKKKRLRLPPAQYTFLGIASLAIIVLQVVAPSGAINYGILRVIQQGLILLSLPIVLASLWLLQLVRIPKKWQTHILATTLGLFFLILSGFIPTLTGGFKPVLALSNSGFYYEAYYTHQDEITADRWLLDNSPKGSRVIADEFARRKMITYTDSTIFAQPTLIPGTIPIDSYVYLSNGNTTFNEIPIYYNGNLLYTNVPTAFLNDSKNLLYNSKSVVIYK
ncbi:MAG TPA: DUF2206 domain-containing protein [Patescibacteria group bacterium]|nr:DUF2206 domain-containing protein [Patescibacteria group bacterium]